MLDAVEAGETVIVTRNGAEIAEVRPVRRQRTFVPLKELLAAFNTRPGGQGYAQFREDADAFFGDDGDRL